VKVRAPTITDQMSGRTSRSIQQPPDDQINSNFACYTVRSSETQECVINLVERFDKVIIIDTYYIIVKSTSDFLSASRDPPSLVMTYIMVMPLRQVKRTRSQHNLHSYA
jgi:hypothetical protein